MKNSGLISMVVGLILVAGVGSLVFWQRNSAYQQPTNTEKTAENIPASAEAPMDKPAETLNNPTTAATGIAFAEVATHNSRESCWATINGNVYDLTSWIPKHPGGEKAILGLCGTDGSAKFNGKHGDAPKQAGILLGFKIGVAVQ